MPQHPALRILTCLLFFFTTIIFTSSPILGAGSGARPAPKPTPTIERNPIGKPRARRIEPTFPDEIFTQKKPSLAPEKRWTLEWALTGTTLSASEMLNSKPADLFEIIDGRSEAKEHAFYEYLRQPLRKAGLDAGKWQVTWAGSEVGPRLDIFKSLAAKAPEGRPELIFALDSINFRTQLSEIKKAWSGSSSELPQANLLDQFFKSISGRSAILVGHIEGPNFVMHKHRGEAEKFDVTSLIEQASKHNVLLLPLGCRSFEAGAPVGFSRNISTEEVASFLRAVPTNPQRMADLLKPYEVLGEAWLNVDLGKPWIEAAIFKPEAKESGDAEARIRFPRYDGGSNGGNGNGNGGGPNGPEGEGQAGSRQGQGGSNDAILSLSENAFDIWFEDWREDQIPWYFKGGLGWYLRKWHDEPMGTYFLTCMFFLFSSGGLQWLSERPELLRERRNSGLVRFLVITATIFSLICFSMIGIAILFGTVSLFWMVFSNFPVLGIVGIAILSIWVTWNLKEERSKRRLKG